MCVRQGGRGLRNELGYALDRTRGMDDGQLHRHHQLNKAQNDGKTVETWNPKEMGQKGMNSRTLIR